MRTLKKAFLLLCFVSISVAAMAEVKISDVTDNGKEAICKVGELRTADRFKLKTVPKELEGLQAIVVPRGNPGLPGTGFSFKVSAPVTVYLFVDKRYRKPKLEGWKKTKMTAVWENEKNGDIIYKKDFPAGIVKISANPKYIIPHMAVIKEK